MKDGSLHDAPRAAPYGWIGLPLSLVAIVVGGCALTALVLALAYACGALVLGWQDAALRVSSLRSAAQGDPRAAEFLLLCLSVVLYGAVAIGVLAAARLRAGGAWRDLVAWHPWPADRRLRLFAATAVVILIYSVAANAALLHYYPKSQEWVTLPPDLWTRVVFFLVATVSAPITEELVFRGWLYTALRAKMGVRASLVASSLLFALAHWEKTHLYALTVFPVGLALGFLRERTGTLKASIGLHALFNGIAFVLLYFGD